MIQIFYNKTSRLFLSSAALVFAMSLAAGAQTSQGEKPVVLAQSDSSGEAEVYEDVSDMAAKFLDRKYQDGMAADVRKKIKELSLEDLEEDTANADTARKTPEKPQQQNQQANRVIDTNVKNTISRRSKRAVQPDSVAKARIVKKNNGVVKRWSLGIAAGTHFGNPMKMAVELASVVDDGKKLALNPMITKGPTANAHALLFAKGVDLAIVNADILGHYKRSTAVTNIKQRVNYITQLFNAQLHVVARPEIETLDDLFGKVVNFDIKGSSASYTGPEIFKRLGIRVKKKYLPFDAALEQMTRSDEIGAMVFVSSKPHGVLNKIQWPQGFRLMPVKYSQNLTDYYLPTVLTHDDYPALVPKWETVETVAVPTLLVSYNWKPGTARYKKVERFVDYMFTRWGRLQKPPHNDRWKSINLSTRVPGWNRLPLVQGHLKRVARLQTLAGGAGNPTYESRSTVNGPMRERFEDFLRKYARAKNIRRFSPEQREELFKLFYEHSQRRSQ